MSNWPSGTSTPPILPPDMIETLSKTQIDEKQDTSQHITQQNVEDKSVGLDLGESSSVKPRKTRSKVWEDFVKYKDENGKDRAKCKICEKDFDGSSKLGTTHLRNHSKSCQRKRNEGGGGNLSDTIAIKEKSVMDQQLNHLDAARMIIKQGDASFIDSTIEGYIIDVCREEKEKLHNYFEKLSCRLCLTFYGMETAVAHYTCLMVWFIDDDWKFKNKIIGLKDLTNDETVMKDIKNMLQEWGIENNLSSMVIGVDGECNLYELISCCIERGDWFSNQGSLFLNNKLILKRFDELGVGYNTANTHFPLLCKRVKELKESYFNKCLDYIEIADNCWCKYNLVLAVAAVLDPRFRMDIVKNWYKRIFGDKWETEFTKFTVYFTNMYNEYARDFKSCTSGSEETNSSVSYKMLDPLGEPCKSSHEPSHVQLLNLELHLYLEGVKFPSFKDFDVLEWWRVHSRYFPTLARMARDFLPIQISSHPFSVSDDEMGCAEALGIAEAYICTKSWLAT